jgi:hypothetical protein
MPSELLMDDVYDAKKDLIGMEDLHKGSDPAKGND